MTPLMVKGQWMAVRDDGHYRVILKKNYNDEAFIGKGATIADAFGNAVAKMLHGEPDERGYAVHGDPVERSYTVRSMEDYDRLLCHSERPLKYDGMRRLRDVMGALVTVGPAKGYPGERYAPFVNGGHVPKRAPSAPKRTKNVSASMCFGCIRADNSDTKTCAGCAYETGEDTDPILWRDEK